VTYDTYDSNEILETKLLTGHTGYDVVFPTTTIQGRMARIGSSFLIRLFHQQKDTIEAPKS
jgi:spermidine/putrescine-binding protein